MNIAELLAKVQADLDALEAAIKAIDFTPQLLAIDTRIQAMTGELLAKIEPPKA